MTQVNRTGRFNPFLRTNAEEKLEDQLLSGQGESYERLKQLTINPPVDSSTPAKPARTFASAAEQQEMEEPRQTIQQLAQLVMNSARWRNPPTTVGGKNALNEDKKNVRFNETAAAEAREKVNNWNRFSYGGPETVKEAVKNQHQRYEKLLYFIVIKLKKSFQRISPSHNFSARRYSYNEARQPQQRTGFTNDIINVDCLQAQNAGYHKIGFVNDVLPNHRQIVCFPDENDKGPFEQLHRLYAQKGYVVSGASGAPYMINNGNIVPSSRMIEKYMQERRSEKGTDSDEDEFLDTTATFQLPSRRGSLTSNGTSNGKNGNCIIS